MFDYGIYLMWINIFEGIRFPLTASYMDAKVHVQTEMEESAVENFWWLHKCL